MTKYQKLVLEAFDHLTDIILEIEAVDEERGGTSNLLADARMDVIKARTKMVEYFLRGKVYDRVQLP